MPKFDVTKLNVAMDRLLEVTDNPRHRFLLQSFARHRLLEVAGRYEEILAPDMMSDDPVYNLQHSRMEAVLRGRDQVRNLYRMWAETNQCIFFIETEEMAVADHFIATVLTGYQQLSGKTLTQGKFLSYLPTAISERLLERALGKKDNKPDDNDMFLYKSVGLQMILPHDDRGRCTGEDVWEPKPSEAELIKLDPADVLTTEEARKLLAPLIKPLPSFDEVVLGMKAVQSRASSSM